MPRLLIVYATTDGQTGKIARFLARELQELGARVELFDAGFAPRTAVELSNAAFAAPNPEPFDGVIVAASVHAGGFQRSVARWVAAHRDALHRTNAIFLPVCLSVLQKDPRVARDLARIIDRFKQRTGWIPAEIRPVAGAVLYSRYWWLKRMAMRYIMKKAGGGTDTSRDYEYTDWADLEKFALELVVRLGGGQAVNVAVGMTTCEI